MQYVSARMRCENFSSVIVSQESSLVITVSEFIATNSKLWAYGKAENGSGMETGHGKWKWELEMNI